MKGRHAWSAWLGLAASGWLNAAQALPVAHACNACTAAQIQDKAMIYAPGAVGSVAPIYIYDFKNGTLAKFRAGREPGANGHFTYFVNRLQPSPEEQDYFELARSAWANTGHAMKAVITIDPGNFMSGAPPFPPRVNDQILNGSTGFYGLSRNSSLQRDLTDYAGSWLQARFIDRPDITNTGIESLWSLLNSVMTLWFEGVSPAGLTVTIRVPGGDEITFHLSTSESTGPKWDLVRMSDRNGNDVPIEPDQAAPPNGATNIYMFDRFPQDGARFANFLSSLLGIPVVQEQHGGWKIACVKTPGGSRCTQQL